MIPLLAFKSCPLHLEQEFVFELGALWECAADLRLYVAFMGQRPRAGQVTACLGCTSFGLDVLLARAEALPTWFWLSVLVCLGSS